MMKYWLGLFLSYLYGASQYLDDLLGACFGKEGASGFYKSLVCKALHTCNIPHADGLLSGIDQFIMRPWVKAQAKNADLYATDCLVKTEQQTIVNGHLAWLWAYIFQGYGLDDLQGWAPSYNEQYEYLSQHLQEIQQ